jgi:predicted Zn-dependent protease
VALAVLALPVQAQFQLPNIGGDKASGIGDILGKVQELTGSQSADDEAKSGNTIAATVFGAAPPWRNSAVQTYVNLVGRNLARQAERKDVTWRFAVLDTPAVNAMAFPGGIVVVTRGLYQMLASEDELAAVLAHEIAHVNRKHQWKVIQQQKLVAMGAGALAKADSAQTTQLVADLGGKLIACGLDKSAEYEADRDGAVIAARAGYDSSAMVAVMEKLETLNPGDPGIALMFSTHPSPQDRIQALTASATPEMDAAAVPSPAAARIKTVK